MFLATLDISDGLVQTAVSKMGDGGNISPDKRGKNPGRRPYEIPEETKDSVRDH